MVGGSLLTLVVGSNHKVCNLALAANRTAGLQVGKCERSDFGVRRTR